MKCLKCENRCYLCSVIYGIFGALGSILIWSNDFIFGIVIVAIILELAVNIIFIILIKYVLQIIKVIFCEILITALLFVISLPLWLAVLTLISDFISIFK